MSEEKLNSAALHSGAKGLYETIVQQSEDNALKTGAQSILLSM